SSKGKLTAAYVRPSLDGKGQVIEVKDIETGQTRQVGNPDTNSTSPQLVKGKNQSDLVYLEDNKVKQVSLEPGMQTEKPQTLLLDVQELLKAKRDPKGQLVLVTKPKADEVAITTGNQTQTFKGKAADVNYGSKGEILQIVQRDDGSIDAVNAQGKTIKNLVKASADNGPPTLMRTKKGGVRLFYHKQLNKQINQIAHRAETGGTFTIDWENGAWQMSTKRRVPQPEAPVTDAAVVLQFKLPFGKAHYKPMNTTIAINGHVLGQLIQRVPSGRYVFPVSSNWLKYTTPLGQFGPLNKVTMKIKGIGPGNFHITDHCQLYTRHTLIQECLAAPTAQDAQRIARLSSPEIRHSQPDLVLSNNQWEMPRQVKPGDTVNAILSLFNAGDVSIPAGQIKARVGLVSVGQADYKPLAPFESASVTLPITLPLKWDPTTSLMVAVIANVPGDSMPQNNQLELPALRPYQPSVSGRNRPAKVSPALLGDIVETIDLSEKPFEVPLMHASPWYRFIAPDDGTLQVQLEGASPGSVLSMDLFDDQGQPLDRAASKKTWQFKGQYLYLRVGLKPDRKLNPKAKMILQWDSEQKNTSTGKGA
ncbi:MAG: hypothetical protein JKX85_05010, partial [Phycisphaeraceae bacterium]|nr:hypothetical protein [Phycisphaeraceae bacterium]